MKPDTKQDVEIAVLQEQVKVVSTNVDTIMTNHMPHLNARVECIERKLAYYTGGLAALTTLLHFLQ